MEVVTLYFIRVQVGDYSQLISVSEEVFIGLIEIVKMFYCVEKTVIDESPYVHRERYSLRGEIRFAEKFVRYAAEELPFHYKTERREMI